MTAPPIRVWKGIRDNKATLIASRSERRAAEILGIPIIQLRDWDEGTYQDWMKIGVIYQLDKESNSWEES